MYKHQCESLLSTEGPSFALQTSQLHPGIIPSKVSIIHLSWFTTWVWVLLQVTCWDFRSMLDSSLPALFAWNYIPQTLMPSSLQAALTNEALKGDGGAEEWKGQHISSSIALLLVASGQGCISFWLQLPPQSPSVSSSHQKRPLGFQVLPGNPDL